MISGLASVVGRVKFQVGQHVRISKKKLKLAKGTEQNLATEGKV